MTNDEIIAYWKKLSDTITRELINHYDESGGEITRARLGWYIQTAFKEGFMTGGSLMAKLQAENSKELLDLATEGEALIEKLNKHK